MPYIVRTLTAAADSTWDFGEALDATKKATELLSTGVQGLTVEAPGGRINRDDELTELLTVAGVTDAGRT